MAQERIETMTGGSSVLPGKKLRLRTKKYIQPLTATGYRISSFPPAIVVPDMFVM